MKVTPAPAPAAWMRRGLFVYCRRTLRRRQHNDGGATTGSAGEAQQAPDGGVDDDGRGDLRGSTGGGADCQRRQQQREWAIRVPYGLGQELTCLLVGFVPSVGTAC